MSGQADLFMPPRLRADHEPAPLAVGDLAWCLLTVQAGEVREILVGAAQVRVVAIVGDVYRVEIIACSTGTLDTGGRWYRPGAELEMTRGGLWARADPQEHAAFGAEARRLWDGTPSCA